MKRFFTDFKAFVSKGNVVDMAVGVVIGAAFGKDVYKRQLLHWQRGKLNQTFALPVVRL